MPALSSTMEYGKIVSWLKSPGDRVEKGDNIMVVESDKADMDVESFHEGILATILVNEGESALVGSTIAFLAETEAEIEEAKSRVQTASASNGSASASSGSGTVSTAQPSPPAPAQPQPAAPPASHATETSGSGRIVASPLAKRRATELGLDLKGLTGTGPNGRIVEADVERAASTRPQVVSGAPQTPKTLAAPSVSPGIAQGEVVPLTTLQQAVVRSMSASLTVPTFRVGYTLTTSALDALYQQVKPKGVTMTALLAKAVAIVLEKHPLINSSYTDQGIQSKATINIAVAVAMEDGGLITPVLQRVNQVDLYELSRQWKDLVDRARRKQLQPEEYTSGSFTISNLGMFGVDRFDAILPPNQGAILAVGASRPTVVATSEGAIAIRPQMQVNLTCDHRVIYGAHAAAFLQDLARLLEGDVQSLTLR